MPVEAGSHDARHLTLTEFRNIKASRAQLAEERAELSQQLSCLELFLWQTKDSMSGTEHQAASETVRTALAAWKNLEDAEDRSYSSPPEGNALKLLMKFT